MEEEEEEGCSGGGICLAGSPLCLRCCGVGDDVASSLTPVVWLMTWHQVSVRAVTRAESGLQEIHVALPGM